MTVAPKDISGIVEILTRLYAEIREIEATHGLRFGHGDMRARIEYFHDAVRAFTARRPTDLEPGGRLSVEALAYDVAALRYISARPLSSFNPNDRKLSPSLDLTTRDSHLPAEQALKMSRDTKVRLTELYQQYSVLFAALFKPNADANYRDRVEDLQEMQEQLAEILQHAQGSLPPQGLREAIAHLDNAKLRDELIELWSKNKKGAIKEKAQAARGQAKQQTAALDDAHMQYATAQLALYEEGKDIVKKLAAQGMNLAGKFVETAMAAARGEMGRGR